MGCGLVVWGMCCDMCCPCCSCLCCVYMLVGLVGRVVLGWMNKSSMKTTKHNRTQADHNPPTPHKDSKGPRKACLSRSLQPSTIHDTQPPQPPNQHKHKAQTRTVWNTKAKQVPNTSYPQQILFEQGSNNHVITPQLVTNHYPTQPPNPPTQPTDTLNRDKYIKRIHNTMSGWLKAAT